MCFSKKGIKEIVRFQWERTLCEFLCLCFGLAPAPLIFIKVPISLVRRLQILVIIYLNEMLLMSQTLEELLMCRDTIFFLLTQLGFLFNLIKPILVLVQQIEFLGLEMKLILPQKNFFHEIIQMYQNAMEDSFTLRDLTKFLVELTSTIKAILPENLQNRFLQQTQIRS